MTDSGRSATQKQVPVYQKMLKKLKWQPRAFTFDEDNQLVSHKAHRSPVHCTVDLLDQDTILRFCSLKQNAKRISKKQAHQTLSHGGFAKT